MVPLDNINSGGADMPFLGLGAHFLVALFFAVHAVRTKREMYWLLILFSFPLLGSLVYFLAIYLPQSRLEQTIGKAGQAVRDSLDPGRAMREAQHAFDLTPTAHNQTRLANAMYDAGMYKQAVAQFDACLNGPFANDPEIIFAAARARIANTQAASAIETLEALRRKNASFRPEHVGLALALACAAAGEHQRAGAEFAALAERFSSIEVRAEYAMWALDRGEQAIAHAQLKELNHSRKHMKKYTLALHRDLFKRLDLAVEEKEAQQ